MNTPQMKKAFAVSVVVLAVGLIVAGIATLAGGAEQVVLPAFLETILESGAEVG